jgi:hypothetical protein
MTTQLEYAVGEKVEMKIFGTWRPAEIFFIEPTGGPDGQPVYHAYDLTSEHKATHAKTGRLVRKAN